MTTYRLMDGVSGRPGNGPGSGTSFSGALTVGCAFGVDQGGMWFEGYWWWVPSTNGDTASGQTFALWQATQGGSGTFGMVPGSVATAGALTAGAWNWVPLSAPLLLAPYAAAAATTYGAVYVAATGKTFTSGFPETKNQFGSGDPYSAGITNGPLFGFSSSGGSAPVGGSGAWMPQQPYDLASDPTSAMPGQNDSDANLWLDIQVSDTAPASPTYRAFPNMPGFIAPSPTGQVDAYTLGLEFTLSGECTLEKIWHYSPSVAAVLPARCAIWDVATQTVVPGTDNTSPAWLTAAGGAAAAGDGWIYCDYSGSGVTLAASTNYKVSTFTSDNTHSWFTALADIWGASDPFPSGITQGPLQVLGNAASTNGQDSWHQSATWTYPTTSTNPEYDGIDVEVAPAGGTSHTATASLTVTPSFSVAAGQRSTVALTVTPSITVTRQAAHVRAVSLAVVPSTRVARSGGAAQLSRYIPDGDEARAFKRWLLWEV